MSIEWVTIGPCRLACGDCLEVLRHAGRYDLILVDPPYGIDYQSARRTDKATWKPKIANDKLPFIWWLYDAFRGLNDGGAILCFCRWDVQEAFRLAIEWAGFEVKSQVVWDRVLHGMGDLNGTPAPQHDVIWFATKGRYKFPGARQKSIISAMRVDSESLVHPNEKPLDLLIELVEGYTAPGQTVIDNCMGSGTTLVACARLGRAGIGIERETKYFDIACRRIEAELDRHPLLDPSPAVQRTLTLE